MSTPHPPCMPRLTENTKTVCVVVRTTLDAAPALQLSLVHALCHPVDIASSTTASRAGVTLQIVVLPAEIDTVMHTVMVALPQAEFGYVHSTSHNVMH